MKTDMAQYKDLFVETSHQYLATLNDELLRLEKEPANSEAIDAIFRAAHSLKGQSAAMGYEQTGYLCHVLEDVFYEIKEGQRQVDSQLVDILFGALDALNDSVTHVDTDGTELPIGDAADKLKRLVGVSTVGAGKSERSEVKKPVKKAAPKRSVKPKAETQPVADAPAQPKTMHVQTIPVKVEQLDEIVGTLEELMVHRLTIQNLVKASHDEDLQHVQDKIDRLTSLLQYQIMQIRTVPISLVFEHFPRAVRDLGRMLNKEIELKVQGGDLELDRTIVEKLDEPLTHLIRNAADHGIERKGTITLTARSENDFAVVTVSDNGAGINWQKLAKKAGLDPADTFGLEKALFSGVSTADEVSLISGRGVGMEVVKQTIESLGGSIDVESETGKGTTFTLRLPLTVSIGRSLIVRVGTQHYAIAAQVVDTSIKLSDYEVITTAGQEAFRFKEEEIPLVRLHSIFNTAVEDAAELHAVVVSAGSQRIAMAVDEIRETLEAVIKPLPELLKKSTLFSGVTLIGDGRSALIINPKELV